MIRGEDIYASRLSSWRLYRAAYDGTDALIQLPGVFEQHERESEANYERRKAQAYGFNFSRSIIEILTFYLFQTPFEPDWGYLKGDDDFEAFLKNCDLWGTGLETFLDTRQKQASIYGQVGILVDKAKTPSNSALPYLTFFTPENILDWEYRRNEIGKPTLYYLKLQESSNIEIEWYPNKWIRTDTNDDNTEEGENPLGEIPFVWLINIPANNNILGTSDIEEIAKIDASIIRNLSQIEEIGDYAAFPMLMKPQKDPTQEDDDTVGPTAVLEFDPNYPNAVPAWLESQARDPIEAILDLIKEKIKNIYHSANAGGMNATEVSKQAKSGVALESEFQLLNAKLAVKSAYLEIAQKLVVEFWAKWQNKYSEKDMATLNINRPRNFRVSNLAGDIEAVIMGTSFVQSDTFNRTIQKIVARRMAGERGDYNIIDKEITDNEVPDMSPMTRAQISGDRGSAIERGASNDPNNPKANEPGAQGGTDEA